MLAGPSSRTFFCSQRTGIFICVQCAGIHRKMGTHISKVKSLTLDTWSREQVEHMRSRGNSVSNATLNPGNAHRPPPSSIDEGERESQLEKFIRSKYEYRSFAVPAASAEQSRSSNVPASVVTPMLPPRPQQAPAVVHKPLIVQEPKPMSPPSSIALATPPETAGPKHVRFRSMSTPIPDYDDSDDEAEPPSRVPSADARPVKGILRPRSATSVHPGANLDETDLKAFRESQTWNPRPGADNSAGMQWLDSLTLKPPQAYAGAAFNRTKSSSPSPASNGQIHSMSSFQHPRPIPNLNFQQSQDLSSQQAALAPSVPTSSSIWDDLDFLGSPSTHVTQTSNFTNSDSVNRKVESGPSNFLSPGAAISRSTQPSPVPSPGPAPAPLRPQLTGFVPSSDFGRQLASQLPSLHTGSSYLQPQNTGFDQSMGTSPAPLRPQLTGWNPPSQQSGVGTGSSQGQAFIGQQGPQQPSSFLQPSYTGQPAGAGQGQSHGSTNPFHAGVYVMNKIGQVLPSPATAPPLQRPMTTGTNPFFSAMQPQPQQQQYMSPQQHPLNAQIAMNGYQSKFQSQQMQLQQPQFGQQQFGLQSINGQSTGTRNAGIMNGGALQQPLRPQLTGYPQQTNPFLSGWQGR